jgi:VanZ family protein
MKIRNKDLFKASLICVVIGITVLSLMPPKSGIELGEHDKINHFIAYTVFSLNAGLLATSFKKHLLILPLLIAYGLLMEFCQGFVPGRAPSWLDALANTTGVSIGFFLTLILRKVTPKIFL